MAEQFVLKGVKELVDYSYSSSPTFKVKNNPRGGDIWQLPQWFAKKSNNVQYIECTVLDLVGTNYLAIIPSSPDTQLMVTYDDDVYSIGFSNFNAVDRIAITSKDTKKIVVEYLLPSISGGAIAKRILQPAATIGSFEITGKATTEAGQSAQYKSNATPDASDAVYAWTVEQSGSAVATSKAEITAGASSTGCTVQWKQVGNYDVKCVITSSTATDSPQSDTKSVAVSAVSTVGTVTVSGDATPEAETGSTYTANVAGNNVNDLTYSWSVVDANASISNANASATTITFEKQGNATVQCIVGSSSIADSDSDTLSVVVSTARKIGAISINGNTSPLAGVATNYQVQASASNIVDATYQWSVNPSSNVVIAAATAEATNITFPTADNYTVKCVVSSATANDSPQQHSVQVNTTASTTIGNVSVSGPGTVADLNTGKNYTVSNSGDATGLSYQWTSSPTTGCTINSATTATPQMVFTQDGDYTITCTISAGAALDTPKSGTKNVSVISS